MYINIICVCVCTGVARSVITLLLLINSAAVPCVCVGVLVCVCMCGLLKGPGRVIDGSFSTVNTCKRTHTHRRWVERGVVIRSNVHLTLFIPCSSV